MLNRNQMMSTEPSAVPSPDDSARCCQPQPHIKPEIPFGRLPRAMLTADPKTASRKKAFSHKVRTGCITCKRRRVKCDENKPACLNCKRGNHECLGYAVPKAKIFEPRASSSEEASEPATSTAELPMLRPPDSPFGTREESSSLQHWLLVTSPFLAHYGPEGDFYTVVVPQLAWKSPAIKHMLLAVSVTHGKFHTGIAKVSEATTSRAVSHYISAIKGIRNNKLSKLDVAVASLVAWTLELMQNNLPAAVTHLRATFRLLQEHEQLNLSETAEHLVQTSIRPTARLAKGLTSIMLKTGLKRGTIEPPYTNHLYAPWIGPSFSSIVDARTMICELIEMIAVAQHEDDTRQVERLLSYWFETVRRWDQERTHYPGLTALLLLFNVGMALLPSSDVAGYSYSENPDTIKFVVDSAASLITVSPESERTGAQLRQTLRMALSFVVRFFPHDANRSRALTLLQQLHMKG
ncbi:hypothetical protein PV04_09739 [Phialophora macrospora]|uniref:Zn(2)-C6 fungal-type domain-containing protein n=1 Tax=Phialophora macrospora TaxID=1851006 RepID=A0A0D2DKA1_9EURO|nr:hypothetical protein PV04_09739 [Phialophora macrospora]